MGASPERVEALWNLAPDPARDYFAFSIFLGDSGSPTFSCFSEWVRFTDTEPPREVRQASIVGAEKVLRTWRSINQPRMVIHDAADLGLFFQVGGNALIEKTLAQECISDWLKPEIVVDQGEFGFASASSLPVTAMQRAPTQKLRMQILKRDDYRCRICGRRPADHVDVVLHVHHVRPWSMGGVTEAGNLITLCHTCHNGLDPHFEHDLYRLLSVGYNRTDASSYVNRLLAYENTVARQLEAPTAKARHKRGK